MLDTNQGCKKMLLEGGADHGCAAQPTYRRVGGMLP